MTRCGRAGLVVGASAGLGPARFGPHGANRDVDGVRKIAPDTLLCLAASQGIFAHPTIPAVYFGSWQLALLFPVPRYCSSCWIMSRRITAAYSAADST